MTGAEGALIFKPSFEAFQEHSNSLDALDRERLFFLNSEQVEQILHVRVIRSLIRILSAFDVEGLLDDDEVGFFLLTGVIKVVTFGWVLR